MIGFFSSRRFVPVVALVLLSLALPASADKAADGCEELRLSGDFVVTSQQGTRQEVALSGRASPGGSFTGVFTGKQLGNNDVIGDVTLDFGGGDTLTYHQELEFDEETGVIVGTFEITGGTGRFEGASGSGTTSIDPAGGGTGTFELEGTLCT